MATKKFSNGVQKNSFMSFILHVRNLEIFWENNGENLKKRKKNIPHVYLIFTVKIGKNYEKEISLMSCSLHKKNWKYFKNTMVKILKKKKRTLKILWKNNGKNIKK